MRLKSLHTILISTAYAAAGDCQQTDLGCLPTDDPLQFTSKIYGAGLGLIGGVGLLFIIYGGYTILTSQGNSDQIRKGRNTIFYAIGGIILAIAGYAVYQIVGVDVLHAPGFN